MYVAVRARFIFTEICICETPSENCVARLVTISLWVAVLKYVPRTIRVLCVKLTDFYSELK